MNIQQYPVSILFISGIETGYCIFFSTETFFRYPAAPPRWGCFSLTK